MRDRACFGDPSPSERADELAVGREFEQRVIAAVQNEDVAFGIEGDAHGLGQPDRVGYLQEVFDKPMRYSCGGACCAWAASGAVVSASTANR